MGMFGWNLPAGCTTLPGEEPDPPCEVCGKDIDYCICPECPECGERGNPVCYEHHGMTRSEEQIESMQEAEAAWKAHERADAFDYEAWLQESKDFEKKYMVNLRTLGGSDGMAQR